MQRGPPAVAKRAVAAAAAGRETSGAAGPEARGTAAGAAHGEETRAGGAAITPSPAPPARRPTLRELGTNPRALRDQLARALAARAQPPPPPPARQTIPGKRVMLVGVLTQSRPRASSRVAAAGGTVAKTVDESVSYVVLGDNLADGRPVECSASYQNAQRLGIKPMSEQEFFAML